MSVPQDYMIAVSLPSVSTQLAAIPASVSAASQVMERTALVSINSSLYASVAPIGSFDPKSGLSSELYLAPFGAVSLTLSHFG